MLGQKIKSASIGSDESQPIPHKKARQSQHSLKPSNNNKLTSPFFASETNHAQFWQKLYDIECRLSAELKSIQFLSSKISAVYNPIEYASDLHCAYMQKFLNAPKSVLFIGMNPGPFGMCQTGVPFGHVPSVKDFLQLSGTVRKPEHELKARPVDGLGCKTAEQSGQRFWGLIKEICGDADTFFRNCFVYNLCPLAFFNATGRNITPTEIKPIDQRKLLEAACVKSLTKAIELLAPELIVSIGRYAEDRVKEVFKNHPLADKIQHKCIPHPSPRALNNTNWNEKAKKWLVDNDVMKYLEN